MPHLGLIGVVDRVVGSGKRKTKKRYRMVDISFILSGYQDSNLGPSAPKADALTGLRYTPNRFASAKVGKKLLSANFLIKKFKKIRDNA